MKLQNFFISDYAATIGDSSEITVYDAGFINQLKNVFRYKKGSEVILLDNSGFEYRAQIELLTKEQVDFSIIEKKENKICARREITLLPALLKKDKLEWVFQKATELGVKDFFTIMAERSEKTGLNLERSKKIIREAAEQCGRNKEPHLFETYTLEKGINLRFHDAVKLIAFDVSGKKMPQELLESNTDLAVFIGPEGGWTENEIALFKKSGVEIYSLGSQTLRAETAAIAVASLLLLTS